MKIAENRNFQKRKRSARAERKEAKHFLGHGPEAPRFTRAVRALSIGEIISFLKRFLKGKRVPSHQKCIVSLKENERLLTKLSQFCIKNNYFEGGFMNFHEFP